MSGFEEEEVFEIVDFTSASEWEVFTSKLEEVLLSWQLSLKDKEEVPLHVDLNGTWKSSTADINFAGHPFIVTHHYTEDKPMVIRTREEDSSQETKASQVFLSLMDSHSDFSTSCPLLAKAYGVNNFVVISPAGNEMLTTEDRINLILSSITIAISTIQCRVPVFVQLHSKSQQLYQGVYESKNLRTDFQMVHLKRVPPQSRYLTGLLDIFKEKIGGSSLSRIDVSVSWTYAIATQPDGKDWPQQPPDFSPAEDVLHKSALTRLDFGATKEPIQEIRVSSLWSGLNEDVVVDSEGYTDLNPEEAPLWVVQLVPNEQVASLLLKTLRSFLDACRTTETTEQLLGKNYTVLQSPESPEYERVLGPLTKEGRGYSLLSPSGLPFGVGKKQHKTEGVGPVPEQTMVALLNFLFPDAEGEVAHQTHPYPDEWSSDCPGLIDDSWKDCFATLKSAPIDSLVWRLAIVAVYTMAQFNGIEGLAHLWHEIVLELRYRWENGYTIPGLQTGAPDLNSCRLNQKLQMLNCCINHKMQGQQRIAEASPEDAPVIDEDEFFDAEESLGELSEDPPQKPTTHSTWNQPQGRKERTKMRLLRSSDALYVPVTQESLPMTEDMVEEQAEMMEQLGHDAEGSELRARILSASLLSDMEAFKAANPSAEMEDFVRWHSPRDWVEGEVFRADGCRVEGHLSGRMQSPGNLWQEMWKAAKPVPAWRQKRLFDDTKEAEKILHMFSAYRPAQLATLLLPVIFHASACRSLEELPANDKLPDAASTLRQYIARISPIVRHTPAELQQYEDVLALLQKIEVRISQFKSLQRKLTAYGAWDGADALVSGLLTSGSVSLNGGCHSPAGKVLLRALKSTRKDEKSQLPLPVKKEFILRTTARLPGPGSAPSCHRMYCCLEQDCVRLAGAFTHDTLFY